MNLFKRDENNNKTKMNLIDKKKLKEKTNKSSRKKNRESIEKIVSQKYEFLLELEKRKYSNDKEKKRNRFTKKKNY